MTKEEAYTKVAELVKRFAEQYDSYRKSEYNETLTRRDFIDPFFKALGWDMDNTGGYAEEYREVVHEHKIMMSGKRGAPDYMFRMSGGKPLFFVEAKKPSVFVKEDTSAAIQLRKYAWNQKLDISIITDFEEFSVYDCTRKPLQKDKASVARLEYMRFDEYLEKFDFIWDTFSRERVHQGSFDKYIKSDKKRKGNLTVDEEFLKSLDTWRTYLATNISWNNRNLNEEEINFAVQQTIDRIIFLRIAEDRKIEAENNLLYCIKQGDFYDNLFHLFEKADEKYNSGLFDLSKDSISRKLVIDNKVIKSVISDLYIDCPYEFAYMPIEILGSAYEQFLGKVIRLTPAHHAKIEEKPEVRKAGGVYYTPQYVVDYIVKNTVGKLVEGKTPKEVSKLKILDPACGSGSFLLGAYQFLLNWHRDYYNKTEKASKGRKENVLTPEGRLTTAEKKRILLNNIYGVDIDVNAVEVTKLSLLLKCMEGETEASINSQFKLWNERVLPSLENNIKSGNSLIDTDIYDDQFDFGEDRKIKPFNWQKAFPEVFNISEQRIAKISKPDLGVNETQILSEPILIYGEKEGGGFDIVIGNPPYLGGREWKEDNGNAYDYFIKRYAVAEYQFDMYALFWERGIRLLNHNGMIGFITPNTWLNNQSNKKLRTYILENTVVLNIVDYSKINVFEQATVLPVVTILKKRKFTKYNEPDTEIYEPDGDKYRLKNHVQQSIWKDGDLNIFNIDLSEDDLQLRNKIEKGSVALESLAQIKFGIKIYETGKGKPQQKVSFAKEKVYEAGKKIDKTYRPYLEGKDINPYLISYQKRWLKYGENLAAPRDPALFEGERILVRRIVGKTLISTYTNSDYVTSQLLQIVKPFKPKQTKYLLALLNSKLMAYYFRKKYNRQDKTFPEIRIYELASLPIKFADEKKQKEIISSVEELLELNKKKSETKLLSSIEVIDQKISHFEDKINTIVYEIYDVVKFSDIIKGNYK